MIDILCILHKEYKYDGLEYEKLDVTVGYLCITFLM